MPDETGSIPDLASAEGVNPPPSSEGEITAANPADVSPDEYEAEVPSTAEIDQEPPSEYLSEEVSNASSEEIPFERKRHISRSTSDDTESSVAEETVPESFEEEIEAELDLEAAQPVPGTEVAINLDEPQFQEAVYIPQAPVSSPNEPPTKPQQKPGPAPNQSAKGTYRDQPRTQHHP